ncbi:MAG TPA: thermonuclease family protein, partial [Rhizomicrobium sp.]|nr:thermonuclease family protein [Rhizomicrobium sp.]
GLAVIAALWSGVPSETVRQITDPGREVVATSQIAMPLCHGWPRTNCVIDGDTVWFAGQKIRIADINAPETSEPQCAAEAALGKRATDRLITLLNEGPFNVVKTGDRDHDKYGRALRLIERNGTSLGQTLVSEGLAEHWQGYRRNWCR